MSRFSARNPRIIVKPIVPLDAKHRMSAKVALGVRDRQAFAIENRARFVWAIERFERLAQQRLRGVVQVPIFDDARPPALRFSRKMLRRRRNDSHRGVGAAQSGMRNGGAVSRIEFHDSKNTITLRLIIRAFDAPLETTTRPPKWPYRHSSREAARGHIILLKHVRHATRRLKLDFRS
jgi:hypothetical protein